MLNLGPSFEHSLREFDAENDNAIQKTMPFEDGVERDFQTMAEFWRLKVSIYVYFNLFSDFQGYPTKQVLQESGTPEWYKLFVGQVYNLKGFILQLI